MYSWHEFYRLGIGGDFGNMGSSQAPQQGLQSPGGGGGLRHLITWHPSL